MTKSMTGFGRAGELVGNLNITAEIKSVNARYLEFYPKITKAYSFIEEKLPDELIQFIAPKILGDKTGVNFVEGFERDEISSCNNLTMVSTKKLKNDIMVVGKFEF